MRYDDDNMLLIANNNIHILIADIHRNILTGFVMWFLPDGTHGAFLTVGS